MLSSDECAEVGWLYERLDRLIFDRRDDVGGNKLDVAFEC
jgi:hypothetical protein